MIWSLVWVLRQADDGVCVLRPARGRLCRTGLLNRLHPRIRPATSNTTRMAACTREPDHPPLLCLDAVGWGFGFRSIRAVRGGAAYGLPDRESESMVFAVFRLHSSRLHVHINMHGRIGANQTTTFCAFQHPKLGKNHHVFVHALDIAPYCTGQLSH